MSFLMSFISLISTIVFNEVPCRSIMSNFKMIKDLLITDPYIKPHVMDKYLSIIDFLELVINDQQGILIKYNSWLMNVKKLCRVVRHLDDSHYRRILIFVCRYSSFLYFQSSQNSFKKEI